jgi:hypothetical protein
METNVKHTIDYNSGIMKNVVTMSLERYKILVEAEETLSALQAGGVDSWDGYDDAMDLIEEES